MDYLAKFPKTRYHLILKDCVDYGALITIILAMLLPQRILFQASLLFTNDYFTCLYG